MKQLDSTDHQILHLLQHNAKYTIKEIASEMGMTTTPVYERIKRMEEDGYIRNYVALLDKHKLGLGLVVFTKVALKGHKQDQLEAFETHIRQLKEVVECYHFAGDFDYLLKIVLPNMEAYQQFIMNQISGLANLKKVQSSFVMSEVKCATQLNF